MQFSTIWRMVTGDRGNLFKEMQMFNKYVVLFVLKLYFYRYAVKISVGLISKSKVQWTKMISLTDG